MDLELFEFLGSLTPNTPHFTYRCFRHPLIERWFRHGADVTYASKLGILFS